jgi:hypothetical protein
MGVLDRVREHRTGNSTGTALSSDSVTLVRAEPAAVQRLRFVFAELTDFVGNAGDEKARRFSVLGRAIMEEILEEMADAPSLTDETIAIWFAQFGRLVEWIGTGDDSILPEAIRDRVKNAPRNVKPKQLASH